MGFGPFEILIGTPWSRLSSANAQRSNGSGSKQNAPDFSASDTVIVSQKFSANPGVLASGRRPDRPGS